MAARESTTFADLKPKWRDRFAFFETYGGPGSAEYRAAFRKLPFSKRPRINANYIAFFFGPIYFFVIGLWKKGLTLLGISLVAVVGIVALRMTSDGFFAGVASYAIAGGMVGTYMAVANYAYYLHRVHGVQSWNPFEGLTRRTSGKNRGRGQHRASARS